MDKRHCKRKFYANRLWRGGIKNIEQIKKLFNVGVEKIILNSEAFNYKLISEAVSLYGGQSIVVCIDAKKSFFLTI